MPATHTVTVTDATQHLTPGGYGTFGHGRWALSCTCGWHATSDWGGKNTADMIARDHAAHGNGWHTSNVHGCADCIARRTR